MKKISACKNYSKILIIRFHALGDVVLSTVIPQVIKQKHPDCEIHYFTSAIGEEILENSPYIDKILSYCCSDSEAIEYLKKENYDVIIGLNHTMKNYRLAFGSHPKKAFFKSHKGTSWVENYFYTAKKVFHDVELPERLHLENTDRSIESSVAEKLAKYPKPHIFINPGKYENNPRQGRLWSIDNWNQLAHSILKTYGGTVFVNGDSREREYHLPLQDKNIVVLSGELSLKEFCAALSMADLVISCDSGPCHVASAYNRKTIALLGSTSPDKIKPYGKNGYYIEPQIKCKYCWKKKCKFTETQSEYAPCLQSITPSMVIEKIKKHNLLELKN